jgi:nucleoside-diphosphate-sugar epimerase
MSGDRPLVLAGFGYVAQRLAARLTPATRVRAHARHPRHAAEPVGQVAGVDLDADRVPPIDVDGAAVLYSISPGGDGEDDPRIARWLNALHGTPARMVYLSTTGVYGDRGGAAVTERTPPTPNQPRSRRRLAAERRLGEWCRERGVTLSILRVPAIYGPHRLPLARLRRGEPVLTGAGAVPGYRIHVDDLVTAIERTLAAAAPPPIALLRDDSSMPIGEYLRLVARLAGLPEPEAVDLAGARERLSPGMLEYLSEHRRLDDSGTRAALGLTLRHPQPEDGVRASLGEMDHAPAATPAG